MAMRFLTSRQIWRFDRYSINYKYTQPVATEKCTSSHMHQFHSDVLTTRYQKMKGQDNSRTTEIAELKDRPFSELTLGQKVQRAGKDATYTGIIIAGVGITGLMFYAIGRELFSGQSPSGIYSRAVKLCNNSTEVRDCLGEPIKAYGEMNRRGRRRFVRHNEFQDSSGAMHMQVQFYLEGPNNKGTVHVDMKEDKRGVYQFEFVVLQLDSYPQRTIIVEDNRHTM